MCERIEAIGLPDRDIQYILRDWGKLFKFQSNGS